MFSEGIVKLGKTKVKSIKFNNLYNILFTYLYFSLHVYYQYIHLMGKQRQGFLQKCALQKHQLEIVVFS